jgi:5-methylcytosine-specific restriction endonuclease McrA
MNLKTIRNYQYAKQHGKCYYCLQPMWLTDCAGFASLHGVSLRQASLLQATAEHLHARQHGGKDTEENVVAACRFCNFYRHRDRPHAAPAPERFKQRVRARMNAGGWHQMRLA